MYEHVSIDVLANWVSMLRASVDGAIVLSDNDDEARFYDRCVHDEARVVPAPQIAIPLLDKLEQRGLHGLVATFRGSPTVTVASNMFQPSVGDVASLLLLSKRAESAIRDACGAAWLTASEKEIGPICERAAWIAALIQRFRALCKSENLDHTQDVAAIIDWNVFEPAWASLAPLLIQRDNSEADLQGLRNTKPERDLRLALLKCDGMEVVDILAAATRMYRPRGIAASSIVEPASLIGLLRVAFDLDEFANDEIYWRMRLWERTNPKYPLLRVWRALDPLGVVLDQRYWEQDLEFMLKLLRPDDPISVFKMDLDGFKAINEKLGHVIGDAAIRLYCHVVKEVLGSVGEVYRRGGDEVIVIAPELTETKAKDLAERVRAQIESRFRRWASEQGSPSSPTASIGLVTSPGRKAARDITRLVDEAQMQAKQQGKNRVFFLSATANHNGGETLHTEKL